MIAHDNTVRAEDARPAGKAGECFYCRSPMGQAHCADCVIIGSRIMEAAVFGQPYPMEDYPAGHHVLFWFPKGERGVPAFESGMAFTDDGGAYTRGWSHGGPNSGFDFDFPCPPMAWFKLPADPVGFDSPPLNRD